MIKFCFIILIISVNGALSKAFAQTDDEAQIRELEIREGQAWVKKDSAALFKLFSPNLVVNTPLNKVATVEMIKKLMQAGKIDISYSESKLRKSVL